MQQRIYIDSNEASVCPTIANSLQKIFPVIIKKLPCGDYFIPPVLIERKSSGDFLRSIRDGALWDEIKRIKEVKFAFPMLLVEGSFAKALKFSRFSLSSLYGALWSAAFDWNIQLVWSANIQHTITLLSIIYKRLLEEKKYKIVPIRRTPKSKSLAEIQRCVLEGYSGVGAKTAIKLLTYFKTLRSFVNASEKELAEVVGFKLAKKIFEINTTPFKLLEESK